MIRTHIPKMTAIDIDGETQRFGYVIYSSDGSVSLHDSWHSDKGLMVSINRIQQSTLHIRDSWDFSESLRCNLDVEEFVNNNYHKLPICKGVSNDDIEIKGYYVEIHGDNQPFLYTENDELLYVNRDSIEVIDFSKHVVEILIKIGKLKYLMNFIKGK